MSDDELDIAQYLAAIKKYWVLSFFIFALLFSAILAYTFMTEPIYEAKTLLVSTNQDQGNFLLGSAAPRSSDIETQKIIIQSPAVLFPIHRTYGIDTFSLKVDHIRNSNIIEITVRANDSENAQIIATDIAMSYIDFIARERRGDAQNNVDFIDDKIDAYDEEIKLLDEILTSYEAINLSALSRQELLDYQSLQREMTAKLKIYDFLLTKKEEASLASKLDSANLKIIPYSEDPHIPVKPNKELNIVLGFIFSLGAALGVPVMLISIFPGKGARRRKF